MDITFYWNKNDAIYHWHLHCSKIPVYVRTNPDWEIDEECPADRQRCKECREKDISQKIKGIA